ncbi:MAG: cyclic nucleotide-binding domain-containing protein [Gammaproteobacteria bacterium]|nr:cyclic nucleotide-binding domain-containing protein [Gammaproteobacteria bacterium]
MKLSNITTSNQKHYSLEERAEILDGSIWAQDLSWKEVEYMAKYFEIYDIASNVTILNEADKEMPYIGLILKGKVNVVKERSDGKSRVLSHIGKGRTFGEMSVIDERPSSASIITDGKVMLMALEKANFQSLVDDNPVIGNKFLFKLLKLMSARLREASGRLVDA